MHTSDTSFVPTEQDFRVLTAPSSSRSEGIHSEQVDDVFADYVDAVGHDNFFVGTCAEEVGLRPELTKAAKIIDEVAKSLVIDANTRADSMFEHYDAEMASEAGQLLGLKPTAEEIAEDLTKALSA